MKSNKPFCSKSYKNLSKFLLAATFAIIGLTSNLKSQTTIYTTNFGLVPNVNPSNWTFTGLAINISTNTPSSAYAGASGNAYLGEGNSTTFTNTSGNQQTVSPIGSSEAILQVSTTSFTNVALSFGMRKSSASYNTNATYTLSWSTDGTSYTPIVYTEAAAGSWDLASGAGLNLPLAAANQPSLYIKWAFDRTGTGSNFKIDDVTILGNIPPIVPATVAFLNNDTTVTEANSSATIYLKLTSSNTASSSITVSASALSNASATDYTLATQTIIIPANTPSNTTFPINIQINNDATVESSEYIILRLVNPINAVIGSTNQFAVYIADNDKTIPAPSNAITLNLLSSFSNTVSGTNSAEIVAHDPSTQRLFIANSIGAKLDIVDFVNPSAPSLLASISVTPYGNINSVAVFNGTVACAMENLTNPQDSGRVVFFNANGTFLKQVKVGMMPDMITFNNAGTRVITANEGEPNSAYTNDPDGSVSIINISGGIAALSQTNVAHTTFTVYNGQEAALRAQGIRIFGLGASASKDFEPEYVAVAKDDSRCWVTLQENNAIVEINLTTNTITAIRALGTKDHNLLNNGMDLSNVTRGINIANFTVKGFYLPDAIASYTVGGNSYVITANEGDTRAYSGFSEETRIGSLVLDPTKFPLGSELKNNYAAGRLTVTDKNGDTDNDGDIDTVYSIGARSFSIWNANTGVQVYDSKDDMEQITSTNSFSVLFNVSNTNSTRKDRSDDKGPEPEGVTIGTIGGSIYAFIALERIGGVMVYDVTNPVAPVFVTYVNNRSLPSNGPDRGSEGIIFIPQSQSPNGQHIVIAANEISSTLSIWGIAGCSTPIASSLSVAGPTAIACSATPPVLSVPNTASLTYQWAVNGSAIPGATSNTLAPAITGSYSVAITGGTNCGTSSLSRSFTINTTPTLAITGANTVCIGSVLAQTVTGANSYLWNNTISGNIVNLAPASTGIYTVVGTATNNCTSTITKTISVRQLPVLAISAPNSAVCAGQAVTLTATGATTYTWNTSANSAAIVVNPANSSAFVVTGADAFGCVGTTASQVTVNAGPSLTVTGLPAFICEGSSVTLSAQGASTYSWSNGVTAATTNFTASPSTSVYTLSGTAVNGCSGSRLINLNVINLPTLQIVSSNSTICAGESVTLTASGTGNINWLGGPIGPIAVKQPSITTDYTVTSSTNEGCQTSKVISQIVSACTAINEQSKSSSEFEVYPNPARTSIHFKYDGQAKDLSILNAIGAKVLRLDNVNESTEINISELPSGIYFVTITSENKRLIKKLIIE